MATKAERRILHITTDDLSKIKDTQIAFEDFRDEAGLSYFGGAFGGKYDANSTEWGSSITRFARYNSSPVFKSIVFDQNNFGADGGWVGAITLTNAAELDANSTGNPTPSDVSPRSPKSVNIGELAGAYETQAFATSGTDSISIGHEAGRNGGSENVNIGGQAGKDGANYVSVNIGSGAGASPSNGGSNIAIGTKAITLGNNCISMGLTSEANGWNSISLGNAAGRASNNNTGTMCMGWEAGLESTNIWHGVNFGTQAGWLSDDNWRTTYIGSWAGSKSKRNVHTIAIGVDSGANTYDDLGSVSIGWESGYNQKPFIDTTMPALTLDGKYTGGHKGFNVNIGAMAGNGATQVDTINIGYAAGQGNIAYPALSSINIGTYAGQNTQGRDNIYLGSFSGYGVNGDQNVLIGRNAGRSTYDTTNVQQYLGASNTFELSQVAETTTVDDGNGDVSTYRNMLLSGDFDEDNGWIWANNVFGMAPQAQSVIDAYTFMRKGFMVYNDELGPQYYDGAAWNSFGGGGGITQLKQLTDVVPTPTFIYGKGNSVMATNTAGDKVTYSTGLFTSSTVNEAWMQDGAFSMRDSAGTSYYLEMYYDSTGTEITGKGSHINNYDGALHIESDQDVYFSNGPGDGWHWRIQTAEGVYNPDLATINSSGDIWSTNNITAGNDLFAQSMQLQDKSYCFEDLAVIKAGSSSTITTKGYVDDRVSGYTGTFVNDGNTYVYENGVLKSRV